MIRIKTTYIRDLTGIEYACQTTITQDYELNSNQSLSAVILPSKVNRNFIDDLAEMWSIVDFDGVEHRIVYVKKRGEGESLSAEIKAVPAFFDDFDTLRIYDEYNEHMTAQRCFSLIFADTPYSVVLNGSFEAVEWQGLGGGETRLEMFKRALERYKAEFRIVGNTVYVENLIGRDTQFQYRYRLNASNIVKEHDASALWTYARGYGDYEDGGEDGDGGGWENARLKREYTSPLAQIIGIRHAPPIKDGRISDKKTMDKALKTLVDESLKISIEADIHDLRRQGYPLAQPEMGDRVFVIDERIGLDEEVRVVAMSITRNWRGDVVDCQLTFGSDGVSKRYQSNLSSAVKDITEVMAGRKKIPFSVLDDAVLQATKLIQNANTELQFPSSGGILAVDPNNPNYLVAFTSRGIGVSSDGGATFPEAITGLGINASAITAGVLQGIRIIQDSGSKKLIMDNGEIESYYNGQLAMKLGQYKMEFYNEDEEDLGAIYPVQSLITGQKGLALEVVSDSRFLVGPKISGVVYPSIEINPTERRMYVAGPYSGARTGAKLELYANRRHLSHDVDFTSYDQPAIILDQSDDTNDMTQYFGGTNRRSGAVWQVRWRESKDRSVRRLEANRDGVVVQGSLTNANGERYYLNNSGGGDLTTEYTLRAGGIRTLSGNNNFYVGVPSGGELRVTSTAGAAGSDITYRDARARNWHTSSSIEYKTNIKHLGVCGLEIINDLEVVEYDLIDNLQNGIDDRQVGFISEHSEVIATRDKKAINLYALSAYNTKAIQELDTKLTDDVEFLKLKIQYLEQKVEELENGGN